LLGGKKGNGLIAATYTIKGHFDKVSTAVNPFSIFAIGVFKDFFDQDKN
jgi:hypothetical protein